MNDYLLRYAIENVWCNPTQDRQFVYKLRQLTPRYGVRGSYVVEHERYKLPQISTRDFWHIYQIGQVIPRHLGIPKLLNNWISLEQLGKEVHTLAEVYVSNGIQFPRSETYILVTQTQNLLVAIRRNDRFPDLDEAENNPYLHVYHNAYFNSDRSDIAAARYIDVMTLTPNSNEELRQFQIQIMDLIETKGGYPQYFVNGRFVQEISLVTAGPGDYCEFILDPSIKRVVDLDLRDLKTFNSTLDKERKYILHYDDKNVNTIEYFDDLDVYLCKRGSLPGRFSGVMYHHNEGNWLRMLTHKDYSAPVDRIQSFITSHPEDPRHANDPSRWPSDKWTGIEDKFLRLYIRHSGYERPLVADVGRIQELYRLSSDNILRAMTGADATCPLWRAENLEQSAYVQFMSADPDVIYPIAFQDPDEISQGKIDAQNFAGDVFGYHKAADIQAHNPTKVHVDQGTVYASLPYNYWENATVFEYDSKGILLGYYHHVAGRRYRVVNQTECKMVECITGKGDTNLHGVFGNGTVDLSEGYNFRLYVCKVWAGVPTNEWIDITDLPNRNDWGFHDTTDIEHPKWTWTALPNEWYGYVRMDNYFYLKEMRFTKDQGIIRFGIDNWEEHNGELINKLMEIPFGQLDIFLNNRPIINGLDYFDKGIMTVLNNHEYLVDGINTVLVRGTGYCTPDLQRYKPGEVGWVEYNVLSNNGIYDIHTHKMQRIIVDGHYRAREDLVFEEDNNSLLITDERNGAPFQIQTPQSTFRDVYDTDQQARIADDERDKQVSDYMTAYFPKRTRDQVDSVTRRYVVYSAFSNKVLHDIVKGTLKPPLVNGRYNEMDIARVMASYEWLVPFDILNTDYNTNHVVVYPHWHSDPIGLDTDQYDFYIRVLKLYLQRPMDIAPFVYLTRT
ncbi:hypothetical protein [Pseudomonas phage vB_PaeM_PS119XW]|uniref:Virion structural protein n=2 Tax=root TaxID=1 RepID=A0A5C1K6P0_9CAUD|nr:hypothetical protein PP933_gp008 [Pseudomonas phage vB_PaeM_PS119XW]QEM41737.1 hypothetical protein [Pseudomonas phage vB_PaeM_PS119XW]BEG72648.1 hypothetical protein RVBP21_2760 [Pseudomonas phage BRkr]